MASMLKNRTISILRLVKIAANSIGVAGIETKSMATTSLGNKRPVSCARHIGECIDVLRQSDEFRRVGEGTVSARHQRC